eukprot:GEMP01002706.1.p1 GENE.GEMP01002706.1~~GEMP01002706.1.p1  ORF type:complete len:591 (+),score=127.91 GEMP01002706.1:102-1874(+)
MPGTRYMLGSIPPEDAAFQTPITPSYTSDAQHLSVPTYAASHRAYGSTESPNRTYGSTASYNQAYGSRALSHQAYQSGAPHDRAQEVGVPADENYISSLSRKPTYASAFTHHDDSPSRVYPSRVARSAALPFGELGHAPAFSSSYHISSPFAPYQNIPLSARNMSRAHSLGLSHQRRPGTSVAPSSDDLSAFAPTDDSTGSSIRPESTPSRDTRLDSKYSVGTPRDTHGSIADSAGGSSTKIPEFLHEQQMGEVMDATHDAARTMGQPLIVPHREQALTVKGSFSYVEVIGSMVLFVGCTLSELNVRDGGTCLLDHCTITDAMAAAMDESSADIRGAVNCSNDSSVELRACTISSANIGIKCSGVVRLLWSHVQSRCGIWVTPGGAALVTKCTFRSTGKDFVSEGDCLYYHPGLGGLDTRLMAQDPGGIRTYPSNVDYDAEGPCFSSGTVRLVPDDYPTLQQALDASAFGDSVGLMCFCRGPVVVPVGVRLFGGSIESTLSALQPCVLVKPFGLLEQCDVRVDVSCSVAVQVMRGGLVSGCHVCNDGGIGVVCERGASVCESVVQGKVGIVMEENSLWWSQDGATERVLH